MSAPVTIMVAGALFCFSAHYQRRTKPPAGCRGFQPNYIVIGGAVVFYRARQALCQIFSLPGTQILGQIDQIDLVDPAGLGELPGSVPGIGDGLILLAPALLGAGVKANEV